jgi:hypothetical protein
VDSLTVTTKSSDVGMSFDYHSDAMDHPAFKGELGLATLGFWLSCGSWTSANGRTGVVPRTVAEELGDQELINILVSQELWLERADSYELLRGPSNDWPLPMWRYGNKPDDGRLITVDTDSLQ